MGKAGGTSSGRSNGSPRRADHAHRGARPPAARPAGSRPVARKTGSQPPRLSWVSWIGITGGLLLAGVLVAFAAQALLSRGTGQTPDASSSPSPSFVLVANVSPPTLDAPVALTRDATITISGRLLDELPAGGPYNLRLYVNDELRSETRLGRRETTFSIADVPLAEGDNTISAAIAGAVDESAHSAPVSVTRDGTAPRIQISSPAAGSIVYGETMLLTGTTEANASVKVVDRANGAQAETTAGTSGVFSVLLALQSGTNTLEVSAVDLAGNSSRKQMSVSREESQAAVTLTLSRDSFEVATLPQTISMAAQVLGPDGKPLDGAEVTFSISPPGQMTVTHDTTTENGTASWNDYPLTSDGGLTGHGLVTVLVTLPGGQTLAESAAFTFR